MVLTTVEEEQAPDEARYLLARTRQEVSQEAGRAIIELVTTIIAYRFEQLSRMEVESMLDIKLKETRVYREIKEEGREEEAVNLIIRQLSKRLGKVSEEIRSSIISLPLPVLEDLSEALLDFTNLANLQSWIEARIN